MYKIFVPEPIPHLPLVAFLAPHPQEGNRLFQTLPPHAYEGLFERVSRVQEADSVVAPHEYVYLQRHPSYLAKCREIAQAAHTQLLISAYQDDPLPVTMSGVFVIRPSSYRTQLGKNDILMPAYVEDVGTAWGIEPMPKSDKPVVAFTGKAGFSGFKEQLQYFVRNYLVRQGPRKQGIYFRRHALAALRHDSRVVLATIMRKKYSAHRDTIEVEPSRAREEYIRSIQHAHFTLTPRGDGNYSLRFYETLSLGRIPVLIDTDTPLPCEAEIDYDACVVRVPWHDVDRVGDYIVRFYESHSSTQFIEAQKYARKIFESYLYMPRFLEHLFSNMLPKRPPSPL